MRGTVVRGRWCVSLTPRSSRASCRRFATRIVREWTLARRAELEENWRGAQAHLPLEKVPGPDADD